MIHPLHISSRRRGPAFVTLLAVFALGAPAHGQSTPDVLVRELYTAMQVYDPAPDSLSDELARILHPRGAIRLWIGTDFAGFVGRHRIGRIGRALTSPGARRQIFPATRDVEELECTERGDWAVCYATVTFRRTADGVLVDSFDDVITMRRVEGGTWAVLDADWRVIPSATATTLYEFTTPPTSVGTLGRDEGARDHEYNRRFPLMGKKVYAMGVDLPRPYGVSVIPNWTRQDLRIDSLQVRFNGGNVVDTDFVDFDDLTTEVASFQVKADLWLFPFLNVFGGVGYVTGDVAAPLSFQVSDAIGLIDPGFCSGLFAPRVCENRVDVAVRTTLDHVNVVLGVVPAFGVKYFFFTSPLTQSWTFLDVIEGSPVRTFVWSPRVGLSGSLVGGGRLSGYVGATYMKSLNTIRDEFLVSFPDELPLVGGEVLSIEYLVGESAIEPWNFLAGFNWDVSHAYSLSMEVASGGTRDQVVVAFTRRF